MKPKIQRRSDKNNRSVDKIILIAKRHLLDENNLQTHVADRARVSNGFNRDVLVFRSLETFDASSNNGFKLIR